VFVPDRTWGNHVPVLTCVHDNYLLLYRCIMHLFYSHAGLETATYKYYNPNTCMFDAEGAYNSLQVSCIHRCRSIIDCRANIYFLHMNKGFIMNRFVLS